MTQQYHLPSIELKSPVVPELLSEEQLSTHYEKHHGVYIEKMNHFLNEEKLTMTTMVEYLSQNNTSEFIYDTSTREIYNQVAQSWNHTFFWLSLGLSENPQVEKEKSEQAGSIKALKILESSKENLKSDFLHTSEKLFGSGYVWLVWDRVREFKIMETANAMPPLHTQFMPLLAVDVWEHAYYLDYKNERAKYAEKCWDLLNWDWANSLVSDPSLLHHVEKLMKITEAAPLTGKGKKQ